MELLAWRILGSINEKKVKNWEKSKFPLEKQKKQQLSCL